MLQAYPEHPCKFTQKKESSSFFRSEKNSLNMVHALIKSIKSPSFLINSTLYHPPVFAAQQSTVCNGDEFYKIDLEIELSFQKTFQPEINARGNYVTTSACK
jgi:hypothetical protein